MKREYQNNTQLGEIIREAKKYFAQGDRVLLAQRIGVSTATISHYLNGKINRPNPDIVNAIVDLAEERKDVFNSAKARLLNQ